MIVTHFGLSLSASDTALITSGVTIVAGAFAGWYVKEENPDELKRSAAKAKLVRDFKEKSRSEPMSILPDADPRFETFEVTTAGGERKIVLTHRTRP